MWQATNLSSYGGEKRTKNSWRHVILWDTLFKEGKLIYLTRSLGERTELFGRALLEFSFSTLLPSERVHCVSVCFLTTCKLLWANVTSAEAPISVHSTASDRTTWPLILKWSIGKPKTCSLINSISNKGHISMSNGLLVSCCKWPLFFSFDQYLWRGNYVQGIVVGVMRNTFRQRTLLSMAFALHCSLALFWKVSSWQVEAAN